MKDSAIKIFSLIICKIYAFFYYLIDTVRIYLFAQHKKIIATYRNEHPFHSCVRNTANKPTQLAVIAIYPSDESIMLIKNLLNGLLENGFYNLVISTKKLTEHQLQVLKPYYHELIVRANVGRDFGSYQFGIHLFETRGILQTADTLILANDSMYYPKHITNVIKEMLDTPDVWQCLYENFEHHYHAQSFFLLYRKEVFLSRVFRNFWRKYVPYSLRVHAIDLGEVRLTAVFKKAGYFPRSFYATVRVISHLEKTLQEETIDHMPVSRLLFQCYGKTQLTRFIPRELRERQHICLLNLADDMSQKNPTHVAALMTAYILHAPIKRDLFYRHGVNIFAILKYADAFTDEEKKFMESDLRKKGIAMTDIHSTSVFRGIVLNALHQFGYI